MMSPFRAHLFGRARGCEREMTVIWCEDGSRVGAIKVVDRPAERVTKRALRYPARVPSNAGLTSVVR